MSDFYVQVARKFRDQGELEKSLRDSLENLSFETDQNQRVINIHTLKTALADKSGEPLSVADVTTFAQSFPKEVLLSTGKDGDANYQDVEDLILLKTGASSCNYYNNILSSKMKPESS